MTINICNIKNIRKFHEEEVYNISRLIDYLTKKANSKINIIRSKIDYNKNNSLSINQLEIDLHAQMIKWSDKMKRLGVKPLRLFEVKIDTIDDNFYLWKYNQEFNSNNHDTAKELIDGRLVITKTGKLTLFVEKGDYYEKVK